MQKTYYLKQEKKEELKDGRPVTFFARLYSLNSANLTSIFNGKKCSKLLAMGIINVTYGTPIYSDEMEEKIKYFFNIV